MSLPPRKRMFTVDEYLAMERVSDERHIYLDGYIYCMAGAENYHVLDKFDEIEAGEPNMGMPRYIPKFTVDEYLAMERASEERHVYLDGDIYCMAGESDEHGAIDVNLVAALVYQLKGTPCQARTKDSKVRSGPTPMSGHGTKGLFSYPDIVVICGEVEHHDAFKDVIINPKAIFEILSPTTEAFDRGEKFRRYQTFNPTLTDYLLVSQDQPQIEHFTRRADGIWSFCRYEGLDAKVEIASIGCTLRLAEVYERVKFVEA